MEADTAVKLIYELLRVEVKVVHACNSPRGVSQSLQKAEMKAISNMFRALTGDNPTPEQIAAINNF